MAANDYAQTAQTLTTDLTYFTGELKEEQRKMDMSKCQGKLGKEDGNSWGADDTSGDGQGGDCVVDLYGWGKSFGRALSAMTVGQMDIDA